MHSVFAAVGMHSVFAAVEAGAAAAPAAPADADAGKPCTTAAVIVEVPSDKAEPPPPTAAMRGSSSHTKGIAIAQLVLAILALLTSFSPSLVVTLAAPLQGGLQGTLQGAAMRYGALCFLRLPAIVFLVLVAVKLRKYDQGCDIAALVISIVGVVFTILPIGLINDSNRLMSQLMWHQMQAVAAANLTFQVVGGLMLGIVSLAVGGAAAAAEPDAVAVDDPSDTAGPPPIAATRGSHTKGIAIAQLVLAILALLASTIALVGGVSSSYDVTKATHWVRKSDAHYAIYINWWGVCTPRGPWCMPMTEAVDDTTTGTSFSKTTGPAMVCGASSFLLANLFLVLVAVKLCKYKKGIDIAALVVGIVGAVCTIVPIGLINELMYEQRLAEQRLAEQRLADEVVAWAAAGRVAEASEDLTGLELDYGPGYAAAAACLTFQLLGGLVLGNISLVLSSRGAALSNRGATLLNRGAALSHA